MGIYGHGFDKIILQSILNESGNLSNQQIEYVIKILDSEYLKDIKTIAGKELNKFKKLKSQSYGLDYSRFTNYYNKFVCDLVAFKNYAYTNQGKSDKEVIQLINEYVKDVKTYSIALKSSLKKLNIKGLKVEFSDYESLNSIEDFKKSILNYFKYDGKVPSNNISIILVLDPKDIKNIIPTEEQLKESETKKYTDFYLKFAQFIKKPHKLDGTFNSSHLADICKICGISSAKLNKMVSDNMSPIGKAVKIDPRYFDEEKWAEGISKKLGDCYIIDDFGSNTIYYSISNKKMYWINREHAECEEFFNNFPYGSKEFEDMAFMLNTKEYADYEEGKAVRELFKKIDKEKNFKILD